MHGQATNLRGDLLVLGIESSCDDTACAVLDGSGRVLSSVVSSQLEAHRPYGGVVPEIASREHLRNWPEVSRLALDRAGCQLGDIDVVAATRGPGLIGSLLVGLSLGKSLAYALKRPFFGVHHLEGHLYSPFLVPGGAPAASPPDAFVGLVVSGGHTSLVAVRSGQIDGISQTRDDAMGETFDKIGKRVGLPFPGGARVDELAEAAATPSEYAFRVARCGDTLDFSYSGLKTQALIEIDRLEQSGTPVDLSTGKASAELLGLLGAFRQAAVAQLVDRLRRLREQQDFRVLAVSGGAAANRLLRRELSTWCVDQGVELRMVALEFTGDNAAMIAHTALLRHRSGELGDRLDVDASSRIPF